MPHGPQVYAWLITVHAASGIVGTLLVGSLGATMSVLSLGGAAIGGALAEIVGIVPMLDVAAALTILAGLVVLRAFARPRAA